MIIKVVAAEDVIYIEASSARKAIERLHEALEIPKSLMTAYPIVALPEGEELFNV